MSSCGPVSFSRRTQLHGVSLFVNVNININITTTTSDMLGDCSYLNSRQVPQVLSYHVLGPTKHRKQKMPGGIFRQV
jgi:hypothetical protein